VPAELSSLKNPMQKAFKSPPKKGAFGSSSKSPFGSDDTGGAGSSFQKDMWANMEPVEENEAPWWTQISIAQVVRHPPYPLFTPPSNPREGLWADIEPVEDTIAF